MKPDAKTGAMLLAGSACLMATVFAKPLGIPPAIQIVAILLALIFNCLGLRAILKAKKAGQLPMAPVSTLRKRFLLMVLLCGVTSALSPFILPTTGLRLSSGQMVFVSITTFIVSIGAVWLGMKLATSKPNNPT